VLDFRLHPLLSAAVSAALPRGHAALAFVDVEKVATTRTEDGHKQNTKTGTEIQTGRKKERGMAEEETEGPTPL